MLEKEKIQKRIEEYRNELNKSVENRNQMLQMADQQFVKMQQLAGAIEGLEKILAEEEESQNAARESGNAESKS